MAWRRAVLLWALALPLLALTALLTAAPTQAVYQQPTTNNQQLSIQQLSLSATAGFGDDNAYVIGEWFPVRVTLNNPAPGGQAMRVRVEVDSLGDDDRTVYGTNARDVDLPGPSRKEVTLYSFTTGYRRSIEVRMMQGSSVVARATATITPHEHPENMVIGVASSDSSLLNVLGAELVGHTEAPAQSSRFAYTAQPRTLPARAAITHLSPADIPTLSVALNSLDVLALDDADTGKLTAEQKSALEGWVSRGGMLLAAARPGGEAMLSGVGDLLPVSFGSPHDLSGLDSLSQLVSVPFTPTRSITVPGASPRAVDGVPPRVLASEGGTPLVAIRELGDGQVVYLGLSPGVAPLKAWDGTLPLLKRVLVEHAVRASFGATRRTAINPTSLFDTYGSIFDLPGLNLPEPLLIGGFLFLYIVIVGPVNFLVLRRMRRAELAWVTVPVLVVVFSVVAYLLAYQSKGGDLLAIRASIVHTVPGTQEASAEQFVGLFSPVRDTYSLSTGGESVATEVNSYAFRETPGNPALVTSDDGSGQTSIDGVSVDTWSFRAFMAEHSVAAQSPLRADLRLGDNAIEGTLTNSSQATLQDVALVRGASVQYIGRMAPGQQARVKLALSAQPFDTSSLNTILPAPPGVTLSSWGGYGYPGAALRQNVSDVERDYSRRVELLNMGLGALLSAEPPKTPQVIALAWGPAPTAGFEMAGRTPRYEESNLWTSRLPVGSSGQGNGNGAAPRVEPGSLAFSIYAPGNSPDAPSWISSPISVTLNSAPTEIKPYADVIFRLPPGTKPASMAFGYRVGPFAGQADLLAFNPATSRWDRLGALDSTGASRSSPGATMVPIDDPAGHTGAAGDVTIRILSTSGDLRVMLEEIELVIQ